MAVRKYLDNTGLAEVANHVNTRLKTVTSMPVTADEGAVRLYTGESSTTYIKGHIYQMKATAQQYLQFSADESTYFMSEDGTITDVAPSSYSPQIENVPFTDPETGATLVYMAGNNALVQKLGTDVNVITVNFNKIKTSVMPWWAAGAATGSYNPFTIRNVALVAVTAWVDITPASGVKNFSANSASSLLSAWTDFDDTVAVVNATASFPLTEDYNLPIGRHLLLKGGSADKTTLWTNDGRTFSGVIEDNVLVWTDLLIDTASEVSYDNTESGLVSTNVQGAIDEVNSKTQFCKSITNDTGSDIWCKLYAPITHVLDTDSLTFTLTAGKGEEYKLSLNDVAGTPGMHPMGAGVTRVADAWNQVSQVYDGFAIDKFIWYNGAYYIHVIHDTTIRITQTTATEDILPFEFTISEEPPTSAYVIPVNELPPSFDYMDRVRNSNWAKMGEKYNWDPGFLRQGRIPRKVVVIGNSMTYHGPASYWEVNDLREMAASTPTSGWVSLVYRELKKLNPNIQMYKANGATWETATLGSRSYENNLASNLVAKMTDTGCEATSLTINDVLTSDVDIVICQLYENIGDPGAEGIANLVIDYQNLYDTFREKCPKAFLYQFAGFWQTWNKHQAVVRACAAKNVECVYAFTLNPLNTGLSSNMDSNSHSLYEAKTGDKIYDNNGTEITTVTSTVAGHPNDAGFATMAAHVICRLYNAYFTGTADKPTQQFTLDLRGEDSFVTQLDKRETVSELFFGGAAAGTASDPSTLDDMFKVSHTLYGSVFNFIIFFNGVTAITVNYGTGANHSYIKNQISIGISAYTRFNQTICDSNASYTFERCVNLSATETNPTPWVPVRSIYPYIDGMVVYTGEYYRGRLVKRVCIIPSSGVAPNPNNWSHITNDVSSAAFDTHPTEILKLTSGNGTVTDTGVQNVFVKTNLRFYFDDNTSRDIIVAAGTEFAWAAGRALWVDYI